jgi:uncharacterized protein YaaR (DUF327 family)
MLKITKQWKQAKLQWLQDPSEINGDNLNTARCKTSKYFRNKKREYLKDKINELARNRRERSIVQYSRRVWGIYETCSKVPMDKHLSESFLIQNGLKQEMLYHHCFSTLL